MIGSDNERCNRESGFALLNVLAMLAVASGILLMMAQTQEVSTSRSQHVSDAAEADAIARGGETSAVTGLRHAGMRADDHVAYDQDWAKLDTTAAPIFGGSFSMRVVDGQSKFNINDLAHPSFLGRYQLRRMVVAAGLPEGVADILMVHLLLTGPVERLSDLAAPPLNREIVATLGKFVTALPKPTQVNLNTASEQLIGILLGNPAAAGQLVAKRDRLGELTQDDLASANVFAPPNVGFTSSYFRTIVQVSYGDSTKCLTSLLERKKAGGGVSVTVIDRVNGCAAAADIPQ